MEAIVPRTASTVRQVRPPFAVATRRSGAGVSRPPPAAQGALGAAGAKVAQPSDGPANCRPATGPGNVYRTCPYPPPAASSSPTSAATPELQAAWRFAAATIPAPGTQAAPTYAVVPR